jgi:DNA-binding MarR family transcriptional regulator
MQNRERSFQTIVPRDGSSAFRGLVEADRGDIDQGSRRFVEALLSMCALVLKQRDCCGSYLGVSGPQYVMVLEIARSPGTTVTELARKLEVSGSFIAVEANKLIELGIVEKRANPLDGRSVVLDLSSKGRAGLAQLAPLRQRWDSLMYRSLDGEHVQFLQDMMERMVADGRAAFVDFDRLVRKKSGLPEFSSVGGTRLRIRSARLR